MRSSSRVFYSFRFSEFLMPAAKHLPGSVSVQKKKRQSRACETTLLANVATVTSRHAARQEISSTNTNSPAFKRAIAERSVLFRGADPTSINMSDTQLRSSSGSNHWTRKRRVPKPIDAAAPIEPDNDAANFFSVLGLISRHALEQILKLLFSWKRVGLVHGKIY